MSAKNLKVLFFVTLLITAVMIWKYSWKVQLMYNSSVTSIYTPTTFPVLRNAESKLQHSFIEGKKIAADEGVIFTGLLRDSADAIPAIKKKVELIGSNFARYKVLIVENNSSDNTRELLLQWVRENPRVTILGCGINKGKCDIKGSAAKATNGHSVYHSRIEKMVNLRNIYLDHIRSHPEEFHTGLYKYTAIWDLDTIGVVYLDGIFDTIYQLSQPENNDLSAVCAHGIYRWLGSVPLYYDTYAHLDHSDEFHIDSKLQHDIKTGLINGMHVRGEPMSRVKSCFSGFTIYKTRDLMAPNVEYNMTPNAGKPGANLECEHVRLNATLPGKMALNPSMINLVLLNK